MLQMRLKKTQKVYDTMQRRFCNAVTSAAVRIYECEDEDRCSKQIRNGRVWERAYLSELKWYIFELFSGVVQRITPVNKSFISDLQANFRFSKSSVLTC